MKADNPEIPFKVVTILFCDKYVYTAVISNDNILLSKCDTKVTSKYLFFKSEAFVLVSNERTQSALKKACIIFSSWLHFVL